MKSKLLVTGAAGFLGQAVATRFAAVGWDVSGIGHAAPHGQSGEHLSRWHISDVTLEALVTYAEEPELIVHCAGSGSVPFSMAHPLQDFARTVSCTAAVLEYVRLHSPATRVVYPSSAAVYGVVNHLPINEAQGLEPASPYGTHKMLAEELCRSYARTFGISVSIVRFFSIYGEGLRKQLLWDACKKLEQDDQQFSGTGAELRDWLHVEDAARLVEKAAQRASAKCPLVNGASGEGRAVAGVLQTIFKIWGVNSAPKFTGTLRAGDPPGYQAEVALAKSWGWMPQIGFEEGLERYVSWFKRESA